jgi:hypothetical protein
MFDMEFALCLWKLVIALPNYIRIDSYIEPIDATVANYVLKENMIFVNDENPDTRQIF